MFVVPLSITFFQIFVNKEIFYSKNINYISGATFSVFLIQEHYLLRSILWRKVLKLNYFQNEWWFVFYTFFCVVIVFILGLVAFFIWKNIFLRRTKKIIEKVTTKIDLFLIKKLPVPGLSGGRDENSIIHSNKT